MSLTSHGKGRLHAAGTAALILAIGVPAFWKMSQGEEGRSVSISAEANPRGPSLYISEKQDSTGAPSMPVGHAEKVPASPASYTEFDLRGYPRGLKSHIDQARETHDGPAAFALATLLKKCARAESRMDGLQQGMASTRDLQIRRMLEASYVDLQKFNGQCQAINENWELLRESLLRIALDGQVESSAAELFGSVGVSEAGVVAALIRDASNGDLASISTLTSVLRPDAGIPSSVVDRNRYVLLLAAENSTTAEVVAPYLELARRVGFAEWPLLRNLPEPLEQKFRASVQAKDDVVSRAAVKMDEISKREASETLRKLMKKESR